MSAAARAQTTNPTKSTNGPGSWISCNPWFVVVAAALVLAPALSGCTLLKDEEAFQIRVRSELTAPWTGTVRVLDDGGAQVFAKQVTVSRTSIQTPLHIPGLDGTYTFAVESGGQRWQDTTAMVPGASSWDVVVSAPDRVCFEYIRDGEGGGTVCPPAEAAP